jgi:hypothetical protein
LALLAECGVLIYLGVEHSMHATKSSNAKVALSHDLTQKVRVNIAGCPI